MSGKVVVGVYRQGLSKIFRAAIYRAHRAVVFAIAQLSCGGRSQLQWPMCVEQPAC